LGLRVSGEYSNESENVDELILELGTGQERVELDLMQPLDETRTPRVHEPALHHIGLWVSDLRAAVDWLGARGVRFAPGGVRKGAAGHDVCFIHPRASNELPLSGEGVLIELVQAPLDP
jgi:lactoylglutathione lyase